MKEIISRSDYAIDLHTASAGRVNWSQIRGNIQNPEILALAKAFRAPLIVNASLRDGSLREAATSQGCRCILFEGGGPNQFNDEVIKLGRNGVLRVVFLAGAVIN